MYHKFWFDMQNVVGHNKFKDSNPDKNVIHLQRDTHTHIKMTVGKKIMTTE